MNYVFDSPCRRVQSLNNNEAVNDEFPRVGLNTELGENCLNDSELPSQHKHTNPPLVSFSSGLMLAN